MLYALSFLVLGMVSPMNHLLFDGVSRYEMTLQWLNVTCLLLAALVPFVSALFGEHGATR